MKRPELWDGRLVYMQGPDDMSENGADQTLTIGAEDAGAGQYWYVETTRWAFDDPEELMALLGNAIDRLRRPKGEA